MVSDQGAELFVGMLDSAEVPGTVEGVKAGYGQSGRVPDVVEPRRGRHEIGVFTQHTGQRFSLFGHPLRVRPAAGQGLFEEAPG
ncbi:hypothetical protein GCM10022402_45740 [Salinactinospora qingdaonensis]|uniref:Uncharacterized protein n=1 Tax=Salinactinospora qingdaonensis TaxID=702744 RepID=A0ABP7GDR5_9ACTN